MMLRCKNIFTYAVSICLVSIGFFSLIIYGDMHPYKIHSTVTPKNYGIPYEDVSFRTSDGILLRGWFIPNKSSHAKTIILLHGYGSDKGDILPTRIFLHEKYHLLFFDFRYFGESQGSSTTIGLSEVKDLKAAVDYLHTRGITEEGVWGLSMGAATALVGASKIDEIKSVVSESSYARLDMMSDSMVNYSVLRYPLREFFYYWAKVFLGYDMRNASPLNAVTRLDIPVLLIHSKSDGLIRFDQALLLQQALRHDPKAQFIFIDHYQHSQFDPDLIKPIKHFFASF